MVCIYTHIYMYVCVRENIVTFYIIFSHFSSKSCTNGMYIYIYIYVCVCVSYIPHHILIFFIKVLYKWYVYIHKYIYVCVCERMVLHPASYTCISIWKEMQQYEKRCSNHSMRNRVQIWYRVAKTHRMP